MIDPTRLDEALDLQRRSYQLLLWLSEAVPRGFVSFDTAHEYASSADSARAWIEEHFNNLPPASRPASLSEVNLTRFSNVFASYLETSFDLLVEPGVRLDSHCGCYCPFCTVAVAAPHLQPKRLGRLDKLRARGLERDCLEQLALNSSLLISDEAYDELLQDRTIRESAATIAYALQLMRRCDGLFVGPQVLALWRTFAWTPTGAPRKGFRLDVETVVNAEKLLVEALTKAAA